MKKILLIGLALLFSSVAFSASINEDVASQGRDSYISKTLTNQQLADSIRDNEDMTAVNTLVYSECGKTIFLNSATEFAVTLPAPADLAGCYFKFIVKAAPSGANYTIVTNGGADIMIGIITAATADDLGAVDANADVITFVGAAAVVGDWVDMISDGTSWYFRGGAFVAEGITTGTT